MLEILEGLYFGFYHKHGHPSDSQQSLAGKAEEKIDIVTEDFRPDSKCDDLKLARTTPVPQRVDQRPRSDSRVASSTSGRGGSCPGLYLSVLHVLEPLFAQTASLCVRY